MPGRKIVLAGGSGVLGQRIAADLSARGDAIVILTRKPLFESTYRQVVWDGRTVGSWAHELYDAGLINLAGELVDRRTITSNPLLRMGKRPGRPNQQQHFQGIRSGLVGCDWSSLS
jgi:hypothetical protein